ncbi:MAG: 50S ribosomal protein L20 [Candidatus Yanofskybacteria bacterium]|nr:50S ribosomal protein L20 [Candidatus Yanofskybacteria bacterium]
MARVKRGTTASKRRKNILQHTKGFRWGRKAKYKLAKEALIHAWQNAFRDRRARKRDFRQAWEVQINAAARAEGIPYNRLIHGLKLKSIALDRKILAQLAKDHPALFKKVAEQTKA